MTLLEQGLGSLEAVERCQPDFQNALSEMSDFATPALPFEAIRRARPVLYTLPVPSPVRCTGGHVADILTYLRATRRPIHVPNR